MVYVFGVIFAIYGAFEFGLSGFIFGALSGAMLGGWIRLFERINKLERRLEKAIELVDKDKQTDSRQTPLSAAAPPKVEPEPPASSGPAPQYAPPEEHQPEETLSPEADDSEDLTTPALENDPAEQDQPAQETQSPGSETAESAEKAELPILRASPKSQDPTGFDLAESIRSFITGGNVLVRIGLFVLFFGVAFLIKYAADNDMLSLEIRHLGAALGGIALMTLGWRLRTRKVGYALLLQGGGIGILYMTVYTAAMLYALVPPIFALLVMVGLVICSGVLAIAQDSRGFLLAGIAGGFLAPVLTSTGGGSHIILFSYYAVLNSLIFALAWFKAWREINLLGFAFTYGVGVLWGVRSYAVEHLVSVEIFLGLFFLFYAIISIAFAARSEPRLKGFVDGTLVFGLPIATFAIQRELVADVEYGLAISAFVMSAFYIVAATIVWRRGSQRMRLLIEAFLAIGVVFASMAIPLALDGRWTTAAWALEGAALIWIGLRQNRVLARNFGVVLQFAAGVAFLLAFDQPARDTPLLNGVFLGCMALSAAALFSSRKLWLARAELRSWESAYRAILLVWGLLWWFGAGLREISTFVPSNHENLATLILIALGFGALGLLDRRIQWPDLKYPTLVLAPAVGLFAIVQLFEGRFFEQWGALAWGIAIAVYVLLLRLYEKTWPDAVTKLYHAGVLWIVTCIVAIESKWLIDAYIISEGVWQVLPTGIIPAAMMYGIAAFGRRVAWPIARRYNDYAVLGAGALGVYCLGWVLVSCIFVGGAAPLPYVPLFNPLELTQAFMLLSVIRWSVLLRELAPDGVMPGTAQAMRFAAAFWIFGALTVALARSVHFYGGVEYNIFALLQSADFQAAVSILWSIIALAVMVFATRTGRREMWFIGAGLLGIVAIKLFIVELSTSETIARIISFLAVGVLMLIIGYFSPLPPRTSAEQESLENSE